MYKLNNRNTHSSQQQYLESKSQQGSSIQHLLPVMFRRLIFRSTPHIFSFALKKGNEMFVRSLLAFGKAETTSRFWCAYSHLSGEARPLRFHPHPLVSGSWRRRWPPISPDIQNNQQKRNRQKWVTTKEVSVLSPIFFKNVFNLERLQDEDALDQRQCQGDHPLYGRLSAVLESVQQCEEGGDAAHEEKKSPSDKQKPPRQPPTLLLLWFLHDYGTRTQTHTKNIYSKNLFKF